MYLEQSDEDFGEPMPHSPGSAETTAAGATADSPPAGGVVADVPPVTPLHDSEPRGPDDSPESGDHGDRS